MSWPLVEIGKYVEKISTWNPANSSIEESFSYIDLSSVNKDKKLIDVDSVAEIFPAEAPSRARQLVSVGDVVVSTVRPNLNGVAIVPGELGGATASTGYCVLRADEKGLHGKYLYYWVQTSSFVENMMSKATGANYPAVSDKIIKASRVPLPPLHKQKRIAAILDKADVIRRKRWQAIQLADDFLRAVFLDMFGDPVTNPKGWRTASLNDYGSLKNGLNFERGESGVSVSYLGVGNFKSLSKINGVGGLSNIDLNAMPADDYLLKDGDIVFVRSNGNKALVGRCLVVYPGENKLTFSGFCIRYRIEREGLNAIYLNQLFKMPSVKNEMLREGQGANIQNINQKALNGLRLPIPPMPLQLKFLEIVRAYDSSVSKLSDALSDIEDLFGAISDKAFSGLL